MSEKPLGMRHFWVFRARARQSWSPSSAAGVARDGKDGENAPTEAIGCIIDSWTAVVRDEYWPDFDLQHFEHALAWFKNQDPTLGG